MNWYVLRVKINDVNKDNEPSFKTLNREQKTSEERVLEALKKRLNLDVYTPFIPKKAYPHTKGGKLISIEYKTCFPGYVFIETEKDAEFVIKDTSLAISGIGLAQFFIYYNTAEDDVFRREYAMRESEKSLLVRYMNDDFIIERSEGFIEGDKVQIADGPFVGHEGVIKRLNKRRMIAVIDASFFGGKVDLTVMLEVIEKIQ